MSIQELFDTTVHLLVGSDDPRTVEMRPVQQEPLARVRMKGVRFVLISTVKLESYTPKLPT